MYDSTNLPTMMLFDVLEDCECNIVAMDNYVPGLTREEEDIRNEYVRQREEVEAELEYRAMEADQR